MSDVTMLDFYNGETVAVHDIPVVDVDVFRARLIHEMSAGGRIISLFVCLRNNQTCLFGIVARDTEGTLAALSAEVKSSYPSLTPDCPQAHWFEREIAEQWGIVPEGHPWLKPIRFHKSFHSSIPSKPMGGNDKQLPGVTDFFQVKGEEIHEVAVGPVHAGIIEPGHFRFQCHGEKVQHLEISLGYQHRGVEKALIDGPDRRSIHFMETLAGDTSVGHTSAYVQAIESLAGSKISARAQCIRGIALELERIANHVGDLGAIAGDIGYLPTASFCGRLRGDFLNMTALVCGNRFGRNWIRPGGVTYDIDTSLAGMLTDRITTGLAEVEDAVSLMMQTPSVLARLEDTGRLSAEDVTTLGLVGPPARACGLSRDVRFQFPAGIYTMFHIPISVLNNGDVFARATVRQLEIQQSGAFLLDQLRILPKGDPIRQVGSPAPNSLVVSLTEGWRGEICHVAVTDPKGHFSRYKIVDPSFHNWMGLAITLRGQEISDFPLCNKSFNLSYCGHDL